MTALRTERVRPAEIKAPASNDGLRRALQNSFASPTALPEEFNRLLARLG